MKIKYTQKTETEGRLNVEMSKEERKEIRKKLKNIKVGEVNQAVFYP